MQERQTRQRQQHAQRLGNRWSLCSALLISLFSLTTTNASSQTYFNAGPQIAAADTAPLKELSLEELANVQVITATKEPVSVFHTAAATFVITQEDIRRSGATSIADALRLAPGVEVGKISSDTWAVGIRGLQSNFSKSVLVLIDGRSVYTPLFAGVYWDVQDLVLEDIDRIEVIRGPGATIWGPNSANGVINIVTKHSSDTHGAMVSMSGGQVNPAIGSARYGGMFGSNLNYRIYARGFARGAEYHSDNRNFDEWQEHRGGFRADWAKGPNNVLVEGDIYGGNSPHLVGSAVSDDAISGGSFLARWHRDLGKGSDFSLQTSFDRTIRIGAQLGETRNTFDVDFLHHIKIGERQDFSWGGGLRWSPNRIIAPTPGFDIVPETNTDYVHSGFVQDEIHLFRQRVTLTLGTKFLYNNFSGFDLQPTGRLAWTPNNKQSFWAAITKSATTPSRIETGFMLSASAPGLVLRIVGDPNFKSETVVGFEGGYRQLITSKLLIDLAVFHSKYADLQSFGASITGIELAPPPPHLSITIPYRNDISGTTDGVEIAPSWQPSTHWKLTGSYSYVGIDMHANAPGSDISATGSVPTYEESTPHHQMSVRSTLNLPAGFEFDQSYRYVSSLPAQKIKAYQTMDARIGWNYRSSLELSLVGQNLFQSAHYEWGTGDLLQSPVGVRRVIYGKLVWRK